jgi:hypothetical protein
MMTGPRLGLLATLLVFPAAQAQTTIDAAKITCDQFIGLKVASPDNILIWLSGYYHGKRGDTRLDVQQLKDQPQKVTSDCLFGDRQRTVMDAVEKLQSAGKK